MPQGVGLRPICADEPIHIDYVSVIGGYMVDQSRIFCLGEIPDRIRRIHETALHIQNTLAELGRAGSSAEALYNTALDIARESGYSKGFMGFPLPVSFVGHGVGIELDELPVIGKKSPHTLSSGMVIALEPKFIVPDIGLAGIENTFVVTETGMKKLTLFTDDITLLPRAQSSRSHSDAVRPPA
jgi:Xaa-Pro aminopeptidase